VERCLACEAEGSPPLQHASPTPFSVLHRGTPDIERRQRLGVPHCIPCSPRPRKRGSAPRVATPIDAFNYFSISLKPLK
jgi:hypothetical protein